MGNLCEKLIGGAITADCENPIFAGVAGEAIILNYSQIQSITYDENNGNIITGITMKASTKGYIVQQLGNQPFDGTQTEMADGTYAKKFNNTVNFAVLDNGPDICRDVVDNLANGKFVVIMQNDYKHANADNKYQVYGAAKGLKATSIVREVWGDNESAWVCSFTEEGNPKSGVFFFKEDEETTDEAYNALLS